MTDSDPQKFPQKEPKEPLPAPLKKEKKAIRPEFAAQMGKGRPKGVLNKTTASVKKAIEEAFDRAGGVEYLVKVAHKDPRAFLSLLARLIPQDLKVEGVVTHALFSADQLRRMADAQEAEVIDVTAIEVEQDG